MRRLAVVVAAAWCVLPGPAGAYEFGRGASAVAQVDEQAQACFDVYATDHVYAVASAHGTVTATSVPDPPKALLTTPRGASPTHVVNDPSEVGWGTGFRVCAGGVGSRVVSGRVVYTLHAHGRHGDLVHVLVCTFSRAAAPACA